MIAHPRDLLPPDTGHGLCRCVQITQADLDAEDARQARRAATVKQIRARLLAGDRVKFRLGQAQRDGHRYHERSFTGPAGLLCDVWHRSAIACARAIVKGYQS